ncbi:MAG TPA: PfkB family carbohydrate kinase [Solirubrobacteraceae bacterium]|nr:PfkB family carbohydrate kinase [Solirubrobacteraceae bacterium]
MSAPKVAVVGHVEWVQFARVAHVPRAGEVMHASEAFEEPAGGGAVAAVQLARLAGAATLVTAFGKDDHGRRSLARLGELGVQVEASFEQEPTRRAVTLVDDAHERTITTFGRRLEPLAALVSSSLEQIDGIYFTAGDAAALEKARAATRVLVASPRARHALGHGVELDALVLSAGDAVERSEAGRAEGEARLEVWTEGAKGGRFRTRDGESGHWAAAPLPGEPRDSYGCGDSFAAGLTFGLAAGMEVRGALALAARCGAMCATGRGPYEHQLTAADL